MIHRNVEKALDLLGVQIHGQDAVDAGGHEQVGHEFGGDGHARLVFAVLARIAIKRQHGRDAHGARAAQRIHHDEQLHQIVIGGRRRGLDDEDILAADVFLDFDKRLAIRKGRDGAFAEFNADGFADGAGQRFVGGAGKNFHNLNKKMVAAG